MNILLLVIKNTAVLDYITPVLTAIKDAYKNKNTISILYCVLNKKKILRKSIYYSTVCREHEITEYDLVDFLSDGWKKNKKIWRAICSHSNKDTLLGFSFLSIYPVFNKIFTFLSRILTVHEQFLLRQVDYDKMFSFLNPDIVLMDNTQKTDFYGRSLLFDYLYRTKKRVILLPHAPHHSSTIAFTPFDEKGEALPDFCEFWMPFKYDKSWVSIPEKQSQFHYIGYPGLDDEWLNKINIRDSRGIKSLNCLLIIRRFLPKGRERTEKDEPFIYSYQEFSSLISSIRRVADNGTVKINIFVKPHPSNDFSLLKLVFRENGIDQFEIIYDSIYACISYIDLVVSLYSTILLVPAMVGIPVILLNSRIISSVISKEATMKNLYTGLQFFADEINVLPAYFDKCVDLAKERREKGVSSCVDKKHVRKFFPDGAIKTALRKILMN